MDFKRKKFCSWLLITCIFTSLLCSVSSTGEAEECFLYHENGEEVSSVEWRKGITLPSIKDTIKTREKLITFKSLNMAIDTIYVNGKYYKDYFFIDKYEKYFYDNRSSNYNLHTEDFHKYEDTESEVNMKIKVVFYCGDFGQREITFTQPITDTNNHDPEFLKNSYNYTLAMPLARGFQLAPYDPIVVRDVDLTNDNITFEMKPQIHGFSVSFLGKDPLNVKNHLAKLEISDTVYLTEDVSFTLYATDAGTPPRMTNTTINIKIDAAHSLPRFSQSLYTADLTLFYNRKKEHISLRFVPAEIKLIQGYEGEHRFEIQGIAEDYKKHFQITETNKSCEMAKCVQIELVDLPTDFWDHQQDFFIFLKAIKNSFEATTVLYIRVPGTSNTVVVSEVHVDIANRTIGAGLTFVAIFCLCYVAYVFLIKQKTMSYDVVKIPPAQNYPVKNKI